MYPLIIFFVAILGVFMLLNKSQKNDLGTKSQKIPKIKIQNNLKKKIKVYSLPEKNYTSFIKPDKIKIDKEKIKPGETESLKVEKNCIIIVYIDENLFSMHKLDENIPQKLYVGGMITKNIPESTSRVPIKDMPEIIIHNLTKTSLNLFTGYGYSQSIINVPAETNITYQGRDQEGIQTGVIIKSDLFQDVKLCQKITDLYYIGIY